MTVKDGITPELERLIKKSRNLSPAMRKVEGLVMRPLRTRAWQSSGLHSVSGDLKKSVKTWHGKKSAGISVHTLPGKDLIIPKAVTMTDGAQRGSYTKKRKYRVRGHRRGAAAVKTYQRRNPGSPWGDIKSRPFIPAGMEPHDIAKAGEIISEFLTHV